jgi:hypothetical protein
MSLDFFNGSIELGLPNGGQHYLEGRGFQPNLLIRGGVRPVCTVLASDVHPVQIWCGVR